MAYVVYTSSGTLLTSISAGVVNSNTTSLSLIGRDVVGYGQYYNQNLVSMLTNFSNRTSPSNPLQGQLWYDSNYNKLKVYNNAWQTVRASAVSAVQPTGQDPGEFWYDTTNKALNFLDNQGLYNNVSIFPRNSISGWQYPLSPILDNTIPTNIPKKVTLLQHYGQIIGAVTTSSFTVSDQQSTEIFAAANTSSFQLAEGLSIIGDIQATGNFIATQTSPASSSAPGTLGQIAWDDDYIYIHTNAGWKRLAIQLQTF